MFLVSLTETVNLEKPRIDVFKLGAWIKSVTRLTFNFDKVNNYIDKYRRFTIDRPILHSYPKDKFRKGSLDFLRYLKNIISCNVSKLPHNPPCIERIQSFLSPPVSPIFYAWPGEPELSRTKQFLVARVTVKLQPLKTFVILFDRKHLLGCLYLKKTSWNWNNHNFVKEAVKK